MKLAKILIVCVSTITSGLAEISAQFTVVSVVRADVNHLCTSSPASGINTKVNKHGGTLKQKYQ